MTSSPDADAGRWLSAAAVLDGRAKDWARRSDKWHAALVRERRWSQSGVAVPPAVFALATLLIALGMPGQALITAAAGFVASVVGLRAHFGRQRLDADKTELAWVTADRMAEAYRSLLSRAGSGESAGELLRTSDLMEARARFGLPDGLLEAMELAAAPASNEPLYGVIPDRARFAVGQHPDGREVHEHEIAPSNQHGCIADFSTSNEDKKTGNWSPEHPIMSGRRNWRTPPLRTSMRAHLHQQLNYNLELACEAERTNDAAGVTRHLRRALDAERRLQLLDGTARQGCEPGTGPARFTARSPSTTSTLA